MKALCVVFSIILLLHFMASTLTFQWISIYSITTIIYSFYNCFWILARFNFWYFLSIKGPAYEIDIQLSSQICIVSWGGGGGGVWWLKQPKIFYMAPGPNKALLASWVSQSPRLLLVLQQKYPLYRSYLKYPGCPHKRTKAAEQPRLTISEGTSRWRRACQTISLHQKRVRETEDYTCFPSGKR